MSGPVEEWVEVVEKGEPESAYYTPGHTALAIVAKLTAQQEQIAPLEKHLAAFMRAYEADCECRGVKPTDLVENHTWLAIAYREATEAYPALTQQGAE